MGLIDGEVPGHTKDFGVSLMEGGRIGFGTGSLAWGQDITIISNVSVNDDKWHHIVVTRNSKSGYLQIYIDGDRKMWGWGHKGTLDAPPRLTVGVL